MIYDDLPTTSIYKWWFSSLQTVNLREGMFIA